MFKQALQILLVFGVTMAAVNVEAAWFYYNGAYYWGSVECEATGGGGGQEGSGTLACQVNLANYSLWCQNPKDKDTGAAEPIQAQPNSEVIVPLGSETDLGNGQWLVQVLLPNLIPPIEGEEPYTSESEEDFAIRLNEWIEMTFGKEKNTKNICHQKNFTAVAATLVGFESTQLLQQCKRYSKKTGDCAQWETTTDQRFRCEIPLDENGDYPDPGPDEVVEIPCEEI